MLGRTVLFLALGAFASAQTLEGFPNSISCQQDAGGEATVSKAELKEAIVGPKGTMSDPSAANVASGKCSTLSGIPLYTVGAAGKANVGFAFDKAKNTYHYCFAQGAVDKKIGYPSQCTEK
ncbi:uncharacterized protein CTRU02_210422 [Colletotrichum truncatum]|uniref:Uncharacterized protein n=1 Tax=Colletotrichum truncatum TaxID=5467 RepID=A0ACC3YNY0_COLTU|nr:uncharacterized protein CTRU02_13976 [Colletotrichum truncatum]KAF6782819.1 hypothetical protein CTRU02_13976 [Colletotrichum truncatum]